MSFKQRSKKTKRFSFQVNRNYTSHQTGANTFTITGRDYDATKNGYQTQTGTFGPDHQLTMTVKEAKALKNFLNKTLD